MQPTQPLFAFGSRRLVAADVREEMMNDIMKRIKALSVTYYVLGVLCIPASFLVPVVMWTGVLNDQQIPPPPAARAILVAFALASLLCSLAMSACILYAGHALAMHKARTFIIVVASLLCLSVPIGTVIGVLTLIVLTKPEAKELFSPNHPVEAMASLRSATPHG